MDTPNATPQTPHSELHTPHSPAACAVLKADGQPCRARPIPGSDYCPFHHPDHSSAFADGRAQGGAAPRRRVRRLPVILDHLHVAEFLSELIVDAMNAPDGSDLRRLHAVTQATRVLLKAVGAPQGCFFLHPDRRDTPAHLAHLRRYYPPLAADDRPAEPAPPAAARPAEELEAPAPPCRPHPPGPAFPTMGLYDPHGEVRQQVRYLEPDSSIDAHPWNVRRNEPEPRPRAPAASSPAEPLLGPTQPTPADPLPVEYSQAGTPSSLEARPHEAEPLPGARGPLPSQHPGQPAGKTPAHAADKRGTSAPATTNESASVDPDLCPPQDLEDNPAASTPDVEPPPPSPDTPPSDEPEPPPRRPCIALFSVRPPPGSRSPW
jgi:hypothetical protein